MKVKIANVTGYNRGNIVELPDDRAQVYIANGQAASLDAPPATVKAMPTVNRMISTKKTRIPSDDE